MTETNNEFTIDSFYLQLPTRISPHMLSTPVEAPDDDLECLEEISDIKLKNSSLPRHHQLYEQSYFAHQRDSSLKSSFVIGLEKTGPVKSRNYFTSTLTTKNKLPTVVEEQNAS